jgi:hypothetical protein
MMERTLCFSLETKGIRAIQLLLPSCVRAGYLLVPEMDCEQLPREYNDGTCTCTLPIRLEATGTSCV